MASQLPRSRMEQPEQYDPYAANPTIVLPVSHQRPEEADMWMTNAAIGGITPDVLEAVFPQPLRSGTQDLWAMSSLHHVARGVWQATADEPNQSSDFLIHEPISVAPQPDSIVYQTILPPLPIANAVPVQQTPIPVTPIRTATATDSVFQDALRSLSVTISAAIEQRLIDQGEQLPTDQTAANELIRRLAINYLRHDRIATEAVSDAMDGERLLGAICDELLGYGPLEPLLRDEAITEILVSGPQTTWIEQGGVVQEVPVRFEDEAHLLRTIQKMLASIGQSVNATNPIANGRLMDGSRISVVVPPSVVSGPALNIRRLLRRTYSLEQLVRMETLSLPMTEFLYLCTEARLNILITGAAGTGKTTILHSIASSISEQERIAIIEDYPELQLRHRHTLHFKMGIPGITKTDLLASAMRMHPQRIIVSECQSTDAFELIQAMNVGYDGTMSTLYANSARDALSRLEALAFQTSSGLSPLAIRQQVATGIDLIIHCARLRDGTRRIMSITDVMGMEGDTIAIQDIFVFREGGFDMGTGRIRGEFVALTNRPSFSNRIEKLTPPQFISRGA